jgi:hypothetical protein
MTHPYRKPMSEEERTRLEPAIAKLEGAFDELHNELARIGRPVDPDAEPGSTRCLFPGCKCQGFRFGGSALACKTPGCGHRFFRHDVF